MEKIYFNVDYRITSW